MLEEKKGSKFCSPFSLADWTASTTWHKIRHLSADARYNGIMLGLISVLIVMSQHYWTQDSVEGYSPNIIVVAFAIKMIGSMLRQFFVGTILIRATLLLIATGGSVVCFAGIVNIMENFSDSTTHCMRNSRLKNVWRKNWSIRRRSW